MSNTLRQIIKNIDKFVCKDCIYFNSESRMKRCMKFGEKNLLSGKIHYEYATIARETKELCGPNGLYYTKKIEEYDE